tara:strand:+ start:336 stop:479 length:144 start_codon:yes stop_codon:yes gene_type:complete
MKKVSIKITRRKFLFFVSTIPFFGILTINNFKKYRIDKGWLLSEKDH